MSVFSAVDDSVFDMKLGRVNIYLPPVLRIRNRIRIHRIHIFLDLLDPDLDPVKGMDPDPDPSIIKRKL